MAVHQGFHNVAVGIAQQQGIPIEHAYAILAAPARRPIVAIPGSTG